MATGISCYCINPYCHQRANFYGYHSNACQACDTPLMIQPQGFLLKQPLYGLQEGANSEVFEIEAFGFAGESYPKIVKILSPNAAAIAIELFKQEGDILRSLRGHAVPKVEHQPYFTVAIARSSSTPVKLHCLMMEKIEGKTLDQVLENQSKIAPDQAIDWLRQMAQLLLEVHRKNIIHRDLKPGNIMVRQNDSHPYGELMLIDFGAARLGSLTYLEKITQGQPQAKVISLGYTAPEQKKGLPIFKSDLYALGRTFIHLLTGLNPHNIDYESSNLQQFIPHLNLVKILRDLTETDPAKRLPNCQSLLVAINRVLVAENAHPAALHWTVFSRWFTPKKAIAALCILGAGFAVNPLRLGLADYFFSKAETYYMDGSTQEAIASYNRSLFLNPYSSKGNFGKAYICDEKEDHICAEDHYLKTLKNSLDHGSEEYVSSTNNLALIYIQQNRSLQAAIVDLQAILASAQKLKLEGYVHKNLAWGYFATQDLTQSIIHFRKAQQSLGSHSDFDCLQTLINEAEATGQIPPINRCFDEPEQLLTAEPAPH